jgi:hypothetical protein
MDREKIEQLEQIGNALYAIASDQHVKPLEIAELKLLITRDWGDRKRDLKGFSVSDEAHYILVTMDSLQGNNVSAVQAYNDFEAYFLNHPRSFAKEVKERLLTTSREIMNIFSRNNDSTNMQFENVKNLFRLAATTTAN